MALLLGFAWLLSGRWERGGAMGPWSPRRPSHVCTQSSFSWFPENEQKRTGVQGLHSEQAQKSCGQKSQFSSDATRGGLTRFLDERSHKVTFQNPSDTRRCGKHGRGERSHSGWCGLGAQPPPRLCSLGAQPRCTGPRTLTVCLALGFPPTTPGPSPTLSHRTG